MKNSNLLNMNNTANITSDCWNHLTKSEVSKLLNQEINSYNPNLYNHEEFRQVANGFFQAEGCVSARLTGLFAISPVVVLTNNLFPQSLTFFVWLWHDLGQVGNLNISQSPNGQWTIQLRTESWTHILSVYAEYFNLIYGEKFIGFIVLSIIRQLITAEFKSHLEYLEHWGAAITLMYEHLATTGKSRKNTLEEALNNHGINFPLPLNSIYYNYVTQLQVDNYNIPSILFIIGFWLGDCTLTLRIRLVETLSILLIPIFSLSQKNMQLNVNFFNLLKSLFDSLNISYSLTSSDQFFLTIEGIENIFNRLLPLFKKYSQLFFENIHNLNF